MYHKVEDITSPQTSAVRYILAGVSKDTVQTSIASLEKLCAREVSLERFAIKCSTGMAVATPSEERWLIANRLITAALEQSNAHTLVSSALDEVPAESMTNAFFVQLVKTDLKLTPAQQLHLAVGLSMSVQEKVKSAATAFLEELTLPTAALKEDEATVRSTALLLRQLGGLEDLDAQLTPQCGTTLFPRGSGDYTPARSAVSLAGVLQELGTSCVTTASDARALLSVFPYAISERDVAEALGFFASQGTAASDAATYNSIMIASNKTPSKTPASGGSSMVIAMPLLDALNSSAGEGKSIDWDTVLRLLDQPTEDTFKIKNISVVFDSYFKFASNNEYPPIAIFLRRWVNTRRQRVALEYILKHPDKVNRKSLTVDVPQELCPTSKPAGLLTATELEVWRSLAFMEAAVHVASRDKDFESDVFRPAMEKIPLVFLYGLFLGNFPGTIKNFVFIKQILASCDSLDLIAAHILPAAEKKGCLDRVISLFSEFTIVNPTRMLAVMEMIFRHKPAIKPFLKGSGSPRLVVALGMCMEEAGEPSDRWLQRALEGKLHFRASSTENRFSVAMGVVEVAEMLLEKQIYTTSANNALNALVASPMKGMLTNVMDCAKALLAASNALFPEDVEKECTAMLKKMYEDQTCANVLQTIARLMKSDAPRDKQLYACVIGIIFEESGSISGYPARALVLFAELYGQLIARELLPPGQQQRAWGQLLPAIAKPTNALVEEYGITALEQIKSKIAEWPQYGRALRHVKDLDFRVPGIMAAINRGIKNEEKAAGVQDAVKTAPAPPAPKKEAALPIMDPAIVAAKPVEQQDKDVQLHTMDIGTLVTNRNLTSPPRVIQEQINFLIGNTDHNNLDNNAKELAQLLRPEYYEYFSDYLVVKRAALEPNYHGLYIELISRMGSPELDKAIRDASICSVHRLLKSDKIRTDQNERKLLKYLATWLGSITIKKNIPILSSDLNFRQLVYQGIREGKLFGVFSFISNVLACCTSSTFFAVPNPWTMAQLCLMFDVYVLPNIKTTLLFELELLCENLNLKAADIDLYRRSNPYYINAGQELVAVVRSIDISNSPDFTMDEGDNRVAPLLQGMMQVDQPPPHLSSPPPSARPLQATAAPFDPSGQGFARPSPQPPAEVVPFQLGTREVVPRPPVLILPTNVRVVAGLEKLLGEATGKFRAELASLLDRMAVNICDSPLARRPASIAVITSYALIRKDMNYFTNPAETVRSAEAMVRSLTANLCFSSIKKLADMIDQTLTQDGLLSRYPQLPQQPDVIALLATLNEDLLLRRIESISATRAWESLAEQLQAIKERPRYPIMEQLRGLDPNLFPFQHISPPQLDVYADYYNTLPVLNVFNALLRSVEDAVSRVGAVKPGEAPVELSLATLESATDDARRTLFDRVQSAIGFIKPESVVHEASVAIQKLMHCAEVHIQTLEKCTPADAEKCKPVLNANQFLMSFYILILKHCAAANQPAVQEEVTRVYLKQDFKFGYPKVMVPLVCELIAVDAINLKMFDMQLAQSVSRHLKFAGDFIDSAFQQLKLVSRSNVSVTLSALTKLTSERRASRYSMQVPPSPPVTDTPALFQLVPPNVTTLQLPQSPEGRDEAFAKTTLTLVMEWVEKYQERTIRSMRFVQTLQENNMLDSKNLLQFLSIALRMCVEHYATVYLQLERTWEEKLPDHTLRATRPAGPVPYRVPFDTKLFTLCDAFAELVHVLLRCCGIRQDRGGNEAAAKNNKQAENTLLKRVLDMIRNVFHQHYETTVNKKIPAGAERLLGENAAFIPIFQQQPYVRVISNILISLDRESNGLRDSAEVTASVQDFLLSLAPAQYPAFAFGWLELVSHRITIRRSTDASQERFVKLLVCAFRFIELITPTHNSISANGVLFVKCVFKLVVMLLHDFALFLATHYFPLANAIPPHCAQLMNCVLSSFPSEMTLEPPFVEVKSDNPILQRKLSPETTASQQAEIKRIFTAAANSGFNVPELIDRYIRSNDEVIPEEVSQQVLRGVQNTDYRPQRVLLNAIVLHVAITHLSVMPDTTKIEEILPQSNAMRLFRYLCLHFDTQYRYLLLVSFTIHMRFHNIQTNYFSLLFGFLFLPDPSTPEKLQIFIQEQITRALVEKTVIHQPHPWGVMSTFVGLMRDSKFNFWEKSFVTAPHLDQMFAKLKKTIDTTRAKAS